MLKKVRGKPVNNCFTLMAAAPDFNAPAYHNATQTTASLNAFHGQWLILFFYMSDFSFV
ncbi:redoxin domain-containing protein [Sporomusa sp.]|uniref:redoxin domain-containing protein n=1 Tax=Sporomusa sp. TaxID=2078658 RepID=UPI002B7EDA86|nr:redoxin domain-containing protein [Sporomusa sp.]HWR43003.1 redoxin domain-containing protein [Sporomusa sp.]